MMDEEEMKNAFDDAVVIHNKALICESVLTELVTDFWSKEKGLYDLAKLVLERQRELVKETSALVTHTKSRLDDERRE